MSSILIEAKNQSSISLACLKQFDNILSTALLLLLEVMKGLKEVVNELYSSTLTSFFMVTVDEKVGATCDTHVFENGQELWLRHLASYLGHQVKWCNWFKIIIS